MLVILTKPIPLGLCKRARVINLSAKVSLDYYLLVLKNRLPKYVITRLIFANCWHTSCAWPFKLLRTSICKYYENATCKYDIRVAMFHIHAIFFYMCYVNLNE